MTDTDRRLCPSTNTPNNYSLYEGEFIDRVYLGCFVKRILVVVKQKSLYLYQSRRHYQEHPDKPYMFFNINHMNSTLTQDSVEISNSFARATLRHGNEEKLLDLLEAIERCRTSVGPEDIYPKKYLYLNSAEYKSEL